MNPSAPDELIQQRLQRVEQNLELVGSLLIPSEISDGITQAIKLTNLYADSALASIRKVLDFIATDLYKRELHKNPGTQPLENTIQQLVKENKLPKRIAAYASSVRELGNLGAHGDRREVSPEDVVSSLENLMKIVAWYCEKLRPATDVDLLAAAAASAAQKPLHAGIDPAPASVKAGVSPPLQPAPAPGAQQGNRFGIFAAIGVAVVALAVGIWFFSSRPSPPAPSDRNSGATTLDSQPKPVSPPDSVGRSTQASQHNPMNIRATPTTAANPGRHRTELDVTQGNPASTSYSGTSGTTPRVSEASSPTTVAPNPEPPAATSSNRSLLESLTGEYDFGTTITTVALNADGVLTSVVPGQPLVELEPAGDLKFNVKGMPGYSCEFRRDASGAVTEAVAHQPNGVAVGQHRSGKIAPAVLKSLVGEYVISGITVTIALRPDGVLTSVAPGQPVSELRYAHGLRFVVVNAISTSLEFHRDKDGQVTGLTSHQQNGDFFVPRKG